MKSVACAGDSSSTQYWIHTHGALAEVGSLPLSPQQSMLPLRLISRSREVLKGRNTSSSWPYWSLYMS